MVLCYSIRVPGISCIRAIFEKLSFFSNSCMNNPLSNSVHVTFFFLSLAADQQY